MATRQEDSEDDKAGINRRSYMKLTTAAAASAALVGSAVNTASASSLTVVDLGEQGLSNGDTIDPYLDEYFENGVEVRIPQGEYDWDGRGFHRGATSDAAVVGQGEVILNLQSDSFRNTLDAESGVIEIKNLTIRGKCSESSRFRLQAESGGKVLIDNVNWPDGSETGARARPYYSPRSHEGVVEIKNCYFNNFSNNGIYASSPGYEGEGGGQIIVRNCVSRNNNIAGIRVGPDDTIVENCLVLNDGRAPRNTKGQRNMRGIRPRAPGQNQLIENCELIYGSDSSGSPLSFSSGAEGSEGAVRNVKIRNDSSSRAIETSGDLLENWTGENISITGSGNLSYPSELGGVTTGSSAEEPTGEDPRENPIEPQEPELAEDEPEETLIVLVTNNSGGINYEFTSTREITALYDRDEYRANRSAPTDYAEENDDGTWTAYGSTAGGNTSGDSFSYEGGITDIDIEGDLNGLTIFRNGTRVTQEQLLELDAEKIELFDADAPEDDESPADEESPADDDDTSSGDDGADDHDSDDHDDGDETPVDNGDLDNVLIIDGTTSPELAQYKVVVSGQIEKSDGLSSVVDGGSPWDKIEDRVKDDTATGVVAKGIDGYRFSGELIGFQVKGNVDVTVEQADG